MSPSGFGAHRQLSRPVAAECPRAGDSGRPQPPPPRTEHGRPDAWDAYRGQHRRTTSLAARATRAGHWATCGFGRNTTMRNRRSVCRSNGSTARRDEPELVKFAPDGSARILRGGRSRGPLQTLSSRGDLTADDQPSGLVASAAQGRSRLYRSSVSSPSFFRIIAVVIAAAPEDAHRALARPWIEHSRRRSVWSVVRGAPPRSSTRRCFPCWAEHGSSPPRRSTRIEISDAEPLQRSAWADFWHADPSAASHRTAHSVHFARRIGPLSAPTDNPSRGLSRVADARAAFSNT